VAWWLWVLLWLLMAVAAAMYFFTLGRSLWRKASAFFTELAEAADRLSAVSEGLQELATRTAEPADFTSPAQLRQDRILAGRSPERGKPGAPGSAPRPHGTQNPR
jgi:hypothetical protein